MGTWRCGSCETLNSPNDVFCVVCGDPVEPTPETEPATMSTPLVPMAPIERPGPAGVPGQSIGSGPLTPGGRTDVDTAPASSHGSRAGGPPWLAVLAIGIIALLCGVIAYLLVASSGSNDGRESVDIGEPAEGADEAAVDGSLPGEPDAVSPEAGAGERTSPSTPEVLPTEPPPPPTTAPPPADSPVSESIPGFELQAPPRDTWMLVLESLDKTTVSPGEAIDVRDQLSRSYSFTGLYDSDAVPFARDGYWVVGIAPFGSRTAALDTCERFGREAGDRCYPLHTGTGDR